jgi:hypothetical protein
MADTGEKKLMKGKLVEVFGLVKANHLNGKVGLVSFVPNRDGRIVVKFINEKPKLIKSGNLRVVEYGNAPLDKDAPLVLRNPLGSSEEHVFGRIEKGSGKKCDVCEIDLDSQYHVKFQGQWFCEEHYVRRYACDALFACSLRHIYVPLRLRNFLPVGLLDDVYPSGKLPNGDKVARTREWVN